MQQLRLPAPAKLNLFLHITGRRADGYHLLQTLFQMLDSGDELEFSANQSGEIQLSCNDKSLEGEDNLIYRAAMALKPYAAANAGAEIFLDKKLPMGGGLGGGSSDAATTLHALNKLWQLNLSVAELAVIGLKLGADVPLFVEGYTAFAEGVGEKLTPVNLPEKVFLVVTPACHVSTVAVFTHPDLIRNSKVISKADVLNSFGASNGNWLRNSDWRNDCQPLVERLYPIVAITLQWLVEYAPSRMTGTGASLFAEFPDEISARRALANLPANCRGFVARGVNRSPLLTALEHAV
ncbi:4-(cytidine 5'-diphospho)-2-C-methyl-D-erythritol kinase [Rheinheimera sp. 4Y26]|uniref:4-(cytidine 5'-diphospho)-2-C-methyl-D-erythritol kinase n=1 Tax=Rheinheimera sp. 4Y26 TaxID=2977811 RepID=UPI0021B0DB7F|nr:4-(cytidine 5'-diphospho)-2-C-methyl-D-erythritol kinase [Rheinheimera sp. 4Y26]MCT6701184.1 4-(cytidine 5'-diphospho)-2-C-methyl-D-erythritol kinase [Rheinheimera sp. 4Y26]